MQIPSFRCAPLSVSVLAVALFKRSVIVSLCVLAGHGLCGCHSEGREVEKPDSTTTHYAKGFDLLTHNDYVEAIVYNPWKKGSILARYYLVREVQTSTPADGVRIQVPIQRLCVASTTYFEALRMLGETESVVGASDIPLIYSSTVRERAERGLIHDLGTSFELNTEALLRVAPDALMTTAYNAEDKNTRHLRRLQIPTIYNIEWQETTPLGRAEWLRFIAAFYDKIPLADSLFAEICNNYHHLQRVVKEHSQSIKGQAVQGTGGQAVQGTGEQAMQGIKGQAVQGTGEQATQSTGGQAVQVPILLTGEDFRGTWNMPTSDSYIAHLIRDGGGSYTPPGNAVGTSMDITIENALLKYREADLWIGVNADTYKELQAKNPRYAQMRPFRLRQVYSHNARTTSTGGNDYWEGAVMHPDTLLSDLIRVIYPSLLPQHSLTYIKPLR